MLILKHKRKRYRVLFDEIDRALVEAHTWRVSFGSRSRTPYAATNVVVSGKKTTRKMHRLIMGEPPGLVDHRNKDGLDNRRRNMRVATASLQQLNKHPSSRNKSGVVGVHRSGKRWIAQGGDPRRAPGSFRASFQTKKQAIAARKAWLAARLEELE